MKELTLSLIILLLAGVADVECGSLTKAKADTGISGELLELEEQVLELVNQYRFSENLQVLTIDERITRQARRHSQAMANKQILIGHYGFDLRVYMISTFLPISAAAENVGYHKGCSDCAQRAVQDWIDSGVHRKNIQGEYGLTGVGIAKDSNGGYYFTQIFCKEGVPNLFTAVKDSDHCGNAEYVVERNAEHKVGYPYDGKVYWVRYDGDCFYTAKVGYMGYNRKKKDAFLTFREFPNDKIKYIGREWRRPY